MSFTKSDSIYEKIKAQGIEHSDIVYKQAILETGWFKSSVYKNNNNMFGFYYKGAYMKFNSIEDCLAYYKKWQDKLYKDKSKDYYQFLNCLYKDNKGNCIRYAEDTEYTNKLKTIKIK